MVDITNTLAAEENIAILKALLGEEGFNDWIAEQVRIVREYRNNCQLGVSERAETTA